MSNLICFHNVVKSRLLQEVKMRLYGGKGLDPYTDRYISKITGYTQTLRLYHIEIR